MYCLLRQSWRKQSLVIIVLSRVHRPACLEILKRSPLSFRVNYYTSDSLWKIWLVQSIQSIHNSLWTWHDKCNLSAADVAFIMSSSMSAWLLSPLGCSLQKQNGWTLLFCFWGWIMWKMYNKTIIEFGFRMISCSTSSNNCLLLHNILLLFSIFG